MSSVIIKISSIKVEHCAIVVLKILILLLLCILYRSFSCKQCLLQSFVPHFVIIQSLVWWCRLIIAEYVSRCLPFSQFYEGKVQFERD